MPTILLRSIPFSPILSATFAGDANDSLNTFENQKPGSSVCIKYMNVNVFRTLPEPKPE